jgi:hypothetical protein
MQRRNWHPVKMETDYFLYQLGEELFEHLYNYTNFNEVKHRIKFNISHSALTILRNDINSHVKKANKLLLDILHLEAEDVLYMKNVLKTDHMTVHIYSVEVSYSGDIIPCAIDSAHESQHVLCSQSEKMQGMCTTITKVHPIHPLQTW